MQSKFRIRLYNIRVYQFQWYYQADMKKGRQPCSQGLFP